MENEKEKLQNERDERIKQMQSIRYPLKIILLFWSLLVVGILTLIGGVIMDSYIMIFASGCNITGFGYWMLWKRMRKIMDSHFLQMEKVVDDGFKFSLQLMEANSTLMQENISIKKQNIEMLTEINILIKEKNKKAQ